MPIRAILTVVAEGSGDVHRECRRCGENLTAGTETCPCCGGEPVEYELR